MTHVFHRAPRSLPPVAERGRGCWILDRDGRAYLDGSGGAAVSCLGHDDREVIDAIKAQLDRIPFAHTGFFTTGPMEELADHLCAHAPEGLDRVLFVSGGSEAVEAALKLARQYYLEVGEPGRRRVVARRQSYHGNTLGALAAGGNLGRRAPFEPLLVEVEHVSACYPYRGQIEGETPEDYGRRLVAELEATLERLGPDSVMCVVAETVVGATAGALVPVPGYLAGIRGLCDRHGILLVLDEVMCGMGRTGTLHACEQEGVVPDLLTLAKGLGAGYQPIGALLARDRVFRAVVEGSGFFRHGHTYMGHATACAGALAVQKAIQERGLLARVRARGRGLAERLHARFERHPHVGDIRGRGLFMAIELVADRGTKAPFDPGLQVHAKVRRAAFDNGLIVYPMGGTVDGERGDHVLLAPPFVIDDGELDLLVERLGAAVDAATALRGA